ncbi:MAG: SelT/SelW/SelH family protein [Betaproteobacteria bacterium]|nr:SelT/SelW/SelH family protein [Betaproteobacteria bacterium]
MAAALKSRLGVDATLIEASRGIFDVAVDGRLIYSKYRTGRFPGHDEVIQALSGKT